MHVVWRAAMVALVFSVAACASGTSTREDPASGPADSLSPGVAATATTGTEVPGPSTASPTASPTATPTSTPTSSIENLARLAESAQAAATSQALPGPDQGLVEGADASWPQCPKGMGIPERRTLGSPMPLDSARFVVLGLTNGPGFTQNPCLASQVAWARERKLQVSAYSVISWPNAEQRQRYGGAAKAGYAQALANVATLRAARLQTPAIWLDIEPVPDFDWPTGPAALRRNAEVVKAAAQAYVDQGFRVGVYSTTALWARAVGDLRLGLPEWRAAGHTSRAEALRRCGADRVIQGGTAVMAQWVEFGRDRNVTCPGQSGQLPLWFHQY